MGRAARKASKPRNAADTINVRPGVNILTVLSHLNYKPWFAIAEFVDNALQSYIANLKYLKEIEGRSFALQVDIIFDAIDKEITIRDNAAGISSRDFARAFRAADVPPDATGLSEFGMGMKSAACWFTRRWTVRTSALGERTERTVSFDIDEIVRSGNEDIAVQSKAARDYVHYTEIKLSDVARFPKSKTIGKIKEHLADMYRCFMRDGKMQLFINGEMLEYEEPEILDAPYYLKEHGPSILWRTEFNLELSGGKHAYGFAAIRNKGNTSRAGFALFRRERVIQGSADEGYRPEQIFGRSNSYAYQRVFGEIHLVGFRVSHTKDGIQWGEVEEEFLELLESALTQPELPLLQQANGFRAKVHAARVARDAEAALESTAAVIESQVPKVLEALSVERSETPPPAVLPIIPNTTSRAVRVSLDGDDWEIAIELGYDPSISDWLSIADEGPSQRSSNVRRLELRLSMAHPFMERFAGNGPEEIEPLLRVAAALGLAEIRARDGGLRKASTIRRNVNELLREALSKAQ